MYITYVSKWCSKCSSCPPSTSRDMSSKRPPPSFMTCQRSTGKREPVLAWPQILKCWFLIPTLLNIGILLHKQATLGKHFCPECSLWTPPNPNLPKPGHPSLQSAHFLLTATPARFTLKAHQDFPLSELSFVHLLYVFPSYLNGNTHFFCFSLPFLFTKVAVHSRNSEKTWN